MKVRLGGGPFHGYKLDVPENKREVLMSEPATWAPRDSHAPIKIHRYSAHHATPGVWQYEPNLRADR